METDPPRAWFSRERLKQAIAAAPQQDLEETKLRVYIVGAILAYLLAYLVWGVLHDRNIAATEREVLAVTTGFFGFSIGLMLFVLATGRDSVPRRFVGMIGDNAVATYFMAQMGETGAVILFVYLWITVGNNFRYGKRYLHACQLMSIAGFSIVLWLSPFWSQHRAGIGLGVLIALIALPLYVGSLSDRIKEARKTAEEARTRAERKIKQLEGKIIELEGKQRV